METVQYHLAQVNVAKMVGQNINDPVMKDFVDALNEVNALAEKSAGFVWRLKDETNSATGIDIFANEQIITNFSVWETIEHLEAFVYNGEHLAVLRRRREWFSKFGRPFMALWYIPAGHIPTMEETVQGLTHIQQHGPTDFAFDFKTRFAAPGQIIQPGVKQ